MASIEELEASLQREADPDVLSVYADALLGVGDPRGELIALDRELARLALDRDPAASAQTARLRDRKDDRLRAWLGPLYDQQRWRPRNFETGLVRELGVAATSTQTIAEYYQSVLGSPLGPHLRGLTIYGSKPELESVIDLVIARPLPWLRRLTLHRVHVGAAPKHGRPIDSERWDAFVAAIPHVVDLTVIGLGVIRSPIHPRVRTLRLDGGESLVIGADAIPSVTTLDLLLARNDVPVGRDAAVALAALVNPRTFPNLQTLDLSRNEGQLLVDASPRPVELAGQRRATLGPFLDAIEALDRISQLRLPSFHDAALATPYLTGVLGRCPQLTIEIARMFVAVERSAHPRLQIPSPRVWPSSAHGRDALQIAIPPGRYGDELALSSLIDDLEDQFDGMAPDAQAAWLAFWAFLDGLDWEDDKGNNISLPFDAATLLCALDAVDGNGRCDTVAKQIRDARLPVGAPVNVERYWGW